MDKCKGCGSTVPLPLPEGWKLFMPRGADFEDDRKAYVCPECLSGQLKPLVDQGSISMGTVVGVVK